MEGGEHWSAIKIKKKWVVSIWDPQNYSSTKHRAQQVRGEWLWKANYYVNTCMAYECINIYNGYCFGGKKKALKRWRYHITHPVIIANIKSFQKIPPNYMPEEVYISGKRQQIANLADSKDKRWRKRRQTYFLKSKLCWPTASSPQFLYHINLVLALNYHRDKTIPLSFIQETVLFQNKCQC